MKHLFCAALTLSTLAALPESTVAQGFGQAKESPPPPNLVPKEHYLFEIRGEFNAASGDWGGDLTTQRRKLLRGGSVTIQIDNLKSSQHRYKLRVKGKTDAESTTVGPGTAPVLKPLTLDSKVRQVHVPVKDDEWLPKLLKPFNDAVEAVNKELANYTSTARSLQPLKRAAEDLKKNLREGLSNNQDSLRVKILEEADKTIDAYLASVQSAKAVVDTAQARSYLNLVLDSDATLELVRIIPKVGDTPEKQEVVRSFYVEVAKSGGPRLSIAAGANLLLGPAQKTYLSVPALDSLGNQLSDNGRPLYKVARDPGRTHPGGSLQVAYHYVFSEESYDRFRDLIGIMSLGQYKPGFNRMGFTALVSSDLTNNPAFGFGPSLFMDRDATLALSYGVYFRTVQRLGGGLEIDDFTTLTDPTTVNDFRMGFFVGFSWGISAGGEKK